MFNLCWRAISYIRCQGSVLSFYIRIKQMIFNNVADLDQSSPSLYNNLLWCSQPASWEQRERKSVTLYRVIVENTLDQTEHLTTQ